ncbi:MAG: potassium transporter Kup [Bacteroidetes bacterium]|jgi:KUP system potassium uptake protein|nr:potassium transporter Kup [Bacteroidota bacterium]
MSSIDLKKLSFAGFLVSIGIVFGDIGTSPLYVYSAIIREDVISELLVLGSASAIFWTLFFQTTVKYVFITLRADNKGEGGIFSLYTLVRKYRKWLLFPAILGGAFLLADSIITPPVSVSSAIEGLKPKFPELQTMPIVIAIIVLLFMIQRKGTSFVGKLFGPVTLLWFTIIGILGGISVFGNIGILKAVNPYYAYCLLAKYPGGFWLLGSVFLCTTGAEALYSDMGHCGKKNIRISWMYVKICLLLSYFGQAAWLMEREGTRLGEITPFFGLVPEWFIFPMIIIATLSTIIASQALISGSFTLVAEAIRLNLWPKLRILFPSDIRGQLYIPTINWLLMSGCIAIVLYFRESKNMEAAYGLSITLTMMMTTILLAFYLYTRKVNKIAVFALLITFLAIEGSFLVANLKKFMNGGWVTLFVGVIIFAIMYIWHRASEIKKKLQTMVPLAPYIPVLKELSEDEQVPKYATNLVYLTSSANSGQIEDRTIYSILNKQPKRADIYWFVHVDVVDEPYRMSYKTEVLAENDIVWITFKLGFRVAPRINLLFRKVVEEMVQNQEVNIKSRYCSLDKHNITGDFRFVVMQRFLSFENELSLGNNFLLKTYFILKNMGLPDEKEYGLDYSNVTIEKSPLILTAPKGINLIRE